MAMVRYAKAKIVEYGEMTELFKEQPNLKKLASRNPMLSPIKLDPVRYLYIRNHSVSALETWGPNGNGDAFPRDVLKKSFATFIGKRVSVDHVGHLIIGTVLDSSYILDSEHTKGDYVQNILAIDKKEAERLVPGLVDAILNGQVTDTSMGAIVGYSVCSVCGNIARVESEFCEHVRYYKMATIRTASGENVLVYEECYDVEFFEDSIIRPLSLGGLAGGEGADENAKIVDVVTARVSAKYNPYKKDKLPEGATVRPEVSLNLLSEVVAKEDVEPATPQKNAPEFPVKEVKEEIQSEVLSEVSAYEPEVIVVQRSNLFGKIPDDTLEKILDQMLSMKSGSRRFASLDPEEKELLEKCFEQLVELVKEGKEVEEAINVVWNYYIGLKGGQTNG